MVCKACGFRAYSAAVHANVEECPVCGAPLPKRGPRPRVAAGFAGRPPTTAEEARGERPHAPALTDIGQDPVGAVMIGIDAGGVVTSFSPAAEHRFGRPAGSAIGTPLTELF